MDQNKHTIVSVQKSDEEVALSVQGGDVNAFGILVDRYQEKLLRYGRKFLPRREDIEDMVQEVFISAYRNIQSFDTKQLFRPWIYRIAHNAFINHMKRNERGAVLVDFDTFLSHPVYEDPTDKERDVAQIRGMLDRGLDKINPKYKEALVLHYFDDLAYKEIADVLAIPPGTVSVRIMRGREALKKVLEKDGEK